MNKILYFKQHLPCQLFIMNLTCFRANGEMKQDGSDADSEEENEEGDYTVYECPGLAPVRY